MVERAGRIEEAAAVGEGIRRDVDDPHHAGAGQVEEVATAG
jgi:hypothetical protein